MCVASPQEKLYHTSAGQGGPCAGVGTIGEVTLREMFRAPQ